MTYEIAQAMANGNKEITYRTFAILTKTAMECGMSMEEAKREAKTILNLTVNAWNKTHGK
jgi:hypothetical protein